jgi:hypothetical protein
MIDWLHDCMNIGRMTKYNRGGRKIMQRTVKFLIRLMNNENKKEKVSQVKSILKEREKKVLFI